MTSTKVHKEFSHLAHRVNAFIYNRLGRIGKYKYPNKAPSTYRKNYSTRAKSYQIAGVYLYPLENIKMVINFGFNPILTPFTEEGREKIHKQIKPDIGQESSKLLKSCIPNRSVEYMDNRMSRYSMTKGKCEITGDFLYHENVHGHHYLPLSLGGEDTFHNLRILHKDIHKLVHAADEDKIIERLSQIDYSKETRQRINQYRKRSNLEPIYRKSLRRWNAVVR